MTAKTNVTKELTKLQQTIEVIRREISTGSQGLQKNISSKNFRWLHYLRQLIGFLADVSSLFIPLITVYLAFSNFVSMPPTHSLNPGDPLTIPLVIKNDSLINIHDLELDAQIINLQGDTLTNRNITIKNYHIISKSIPSLPAHQSYTILFPSKAYIGEPFTKISHADIQVNISYKALIISRTFTERFRFIAVSTSNGIYEFYPYVPKDKK